MVQLVSWFLFAFSVMVGGVLSVCHVYALWKRLLES